jgi:histidyl-tRNA synthetase
LDRLLAALEELGRLAKVATAAPVFIPYFDAARLTDYLKLAAELRAAGIGVEVYPEAKKLGQQLKYADRKGFRAALIAGGNEFQAREIQLKNLTTATSEVISLAGGSGPLIDALRRLLS